MIVVNAKPRLLDRMSEVIRLHQYSTATERVYLHWVKRYILFHGKKHPDTLGKKEIEGFLTHLAVNRQVAPSTQNVALAAILFLYTKVLEVEIPWLEDVVRAKPKRRTPVVLNSRELYLLLENCRSTQLLPVSIMYGAGLRLSECTHLRVGDLDFSRHTIRIHAGKGGKDRVSILPDKLEASLMSQISLVKRIHEQDLMNGFGRPGCRSRWLINWGHQASDSIGNTCFRHLQFQLIHGMPISNAVGISTQALCGRL